MEIKQIKEGAVISLEVSVSFYKRLQDLSLAFISDKSSEEINTAVEKFKNGNELEEFEYNFETLCILLNTLEVNAATQGLIETVSESAIPAPDPS